LSVVEQNLVCDPFQQTRTTIDRSHGGLGIGLTLAKGLIEMHGGQLSVTSGGPDQGSTFTIRIPLRLQPTATAPSVKIDGVFDPQVRSDAQPAGADGFSSTGAQRPIPQRVLVIDDRLDAILPIRVLLKREGHEVYEAYDGPSGFQMAIELTPDLILCDIGLPGKWNGYDVVRELRQHPKTENTFIVALSGYSQPADRQRAQEAGFNLHLAKPIDRTRLRELISHHRLETVPSGDISAAHTAGDQTDHK
jgi:two-component system CheB/CheR fusion protein